MTTARHRWQAFRIDTGDAVSHPYYAGAAAFRVAQRVADAERVEVVVNRDGFPYRAFTPTVAAYTVASAYSGNVYAVGADVDEVMRWLEAYRAETPGRDLRAELEVLEVGAVVRTHPDGRGLRVERIR